MGREFIFTSQLSGESDRITSAHIETMASLSEGNRELSCPISSFTMAQLESKATEPEGVMAWTSQGSAADHRLTALDRAAKQCVRVGFLK